MASHAPFSQRILIVEDEENARKGYEALLHKWGCQILGVGSAEDGLAKFSEFQPAVVLADVELPGMNGLDLLRHLGEEIQRIPGAEEDEPAPPPPTARLAGPGQSGVPPPPP